MMFSTTLLRSMTRPRRSRCSGPRTKLRMLHAPAGRAAAARLRVDSPLVGMLLTVCTGTFAVVLVRSGVARWTTRFRMPWAIRWPCRLTKKLLGMKRPVTAVPVLVSPRIAEVILSSLPGAIRDADGDTAAARGTAPALLAAPAEPGAARTTAKDRTAAVTAAYGRHVRFPRWIMTVSPSATNRTSAAFGQGVPVW